MKFHIFFAASILVLAVVSHAQDWDEGLSPDAAKMMTQLLKWEDEKRIETDRVIRKKREDVINALRIRLLKTDIGSSEALSLKNLISSLESTADDEPLRLAAPLQKKESVTQTSEDFFARALPRLRVESYGEGQADPRPGDKQRLRVELDGESIYAQFDSGLHLVVIDPEGLVSEFRGPGHGIDAETVKESANRMTKIIKSMPEGTLAVVAVSGYAHYYSSNLQDIVRPLGGVTKELGNGQPYLCIGYNGMKRRGAIEVLGEKGPGGQAVYSGAAAPSRK